jgi:CheY-specific phosphatase CheX
MTSIFEVFERMFYVFLEPAEKSQWDHQARVSIGFTGPLQGTIRAFFSRELSEMMVQNMLNLEGDEITEKIREDCLKEAVNMICGNFLRSLDSSKVFDLSLPVCETPGNQFADGSAEDAEGRLLLDFTSGSGMLRIMFSFSRNA